MKIYGVNAIEIAIVKDLPINKHSDPIEDACEDITVEEARMICMEDPGLIYTEVPNIEMEET